MICTTNRCGQDSRRCPTRVACGGMLVTHNSDGSDSGKHRIEDACWAVLYYVGVPLIFFGCAGLALFGLRLL